MVLGVYIKVQYRSVFNAYAVTLIFMKIKRNFMQQNVKYNLIHVIFLQDQRWEFHFENFGPQKFSSKIAVSI